MSYILAVDDQDELRAMDALIGRALAVDATRIRKAGTTLASAGIIARRPRWLALAASVLIGVSVGVALWVAAPRPSLAREVIGHVLHEPDATSGRNLEPPMVFT